MTYKYSLKAKPTALKVLWMIIISSVSVYVILTDIFICNYTHLFKFKAIMFTMSCLLFLGVLLEQARNSYILADGQDHDLEKAASGTESCTAMGFICCCCPLTVGSVAWNEPESLGLILLAVADYYQTLLLVPLSFVLIFSSDENDNQVDIFVNALAAFVFSNLDDVFVKAFSSLGSESEFLKLYTRKREVEA